MIEKTLSEPTIEEKEYYVTYYIDNIINTSLGVQVFVADSHGNYYKFFTSNPELKDLWSEEFQSFITKKLERIVSNNHFHNLIQVNPQFKANMQILSLRIKTTNQAA